MSKLADELNIGQWWEKQREKQKEEAPIRHKENMSLTYGSAGTLAGLGVGGLVAEAPRHAGNIVGAQIIHHGSTLPAIETIRRTGLDPTYGGSVGGGGWAEGSDVFRHDSHGKVFVTPQKDVARVFADLTERARLGDKTNDSLASMYRRNSQRIGGVVSGTLPFEDFQKRFQVDPAMPITRGGPSAYFSHEKIDPSVFRQGLGSVVKKRLKDPKSFVSYVKNNPGRFGKGIGALGALPALSAAAAYTLPKAVQLHNEARRDWAALKARREQKTAAGAPTRGGFMMASDLPPFKQPRLDRAIQKDSALLPDNVTYSPNDFKRSKYALDTNAVRAFTTELYKTAGGMPTPLSQLQQSSSVGAPKASPPPGPSIADQVKPRGARWGSGIPGAFKSSIGGMSPQKLV